MNPITLQSLATAFGVAGALLGIPSVGVLVLYAAHLVRLRVAPAAPAPQFSDHPDALLFMVEAMNGALSLLGRFLGGLLQVLFDAAAVVAGVGLVVAVACWCTSRGLRAEAPWSRFSASALLTGVLLPVLLTALSMRGVGRVALVAVAALCVVALHAVWAGVAGPRTA